MIPPKNHKAEKERLRSLKLTGLLDTLPEEDYNDFTKMATLITGAKMSTISLVDADRQWFKSRCGVDLTETSREISFCGHTINEVNGFMEVSDAHLDQRFFDNPLVTEKPKIRFYAGVSIYSPSRLPIGTLCVFDDSPMKLSETQIELLKKFGNQLERLIKSRLQNFELKKAKLKLADQNQDLQQFTYTISHDLKSPIYGINSLVSLIKEDHTDEVSDELKELIELLAEATNHLSEFITNLISFHTKSEKKNKSKTQINVQEALKDLTFLADPLQEFKFMLPNSDAKLISNETVFDQIMMNLISNAIKYSGNSNEINIEFEEDESFYYLKVIDNGVGIKKEDQKKIFKLFTILGQKDRNQKVGTGIGLATVKKLVESQGGKVTVKSEVGRGSAFCVSLKKPAKEK